ncbi:MAG: hypothetical protein ABIZ70_12400 [Gemmatimonadales bacterium]
MESIVVLTAAELRALTTERAVIPVGDAVFHLTGSGVADCLQGVLTNDVIKGGEQALIWGAVLTPKGMIISDVWVRRRGAEAWVIVPAAARETLQLLFTRSFPPRLAKARDVTGTLAVRWLTGGAPEALADADLVRPRDAAPFAALLLTEDPVRDEARLAEAGWHSRPAGWADALRLLEGWPTLGREIDEKTLPQEVRFDELQGVRYDKGCYTGQETVARLHFRGHANRGLVGLRWTEGLKPADAVVRLGEREVGSVRTLGQLGGEWVGLGIVRREVAAGTEVTAGDAKALVVELPFDDAEDALA